MDGKDGNDGIILQRNKLGKFIIQNSSNSKLLHHKHTSNLANRLTFSIN